MVSDDIALVAKGYLSRESGQIPFFAWELVPGGGAFPMTVLGGQHDEFKRDFFRIERSELPGSSYLHTLSGMPSNSPPAARRTFSIATSKLLRWDASEK